MPAIVVDRVGCRYHNEGKSDQRRFITESRLRGGELILNIIIRFIGIEKKGKS
jgi:hypothetical protein